MEWRIDLPLKLHFGSTRASQIVSTSAVITVAKFSDDSGYWSESSRHLHNSADTNVEVASRLISHKIQWESDEKKSVVGSTTVASRELFSRCFDFCGKVLEE
jgi:hypothetical protein